MVGTRIALAPRLQIAISRSEAIRRSAIWPAIIDETIAAIGKVEAPSEIWYSPNLSVWKYSIIADVHTPMVGENNNMNPKLSGDGTHPNATGYALISPIVEQKINEALAAK